MARLIPSPEITDRPIKGMDSLSPPETVQDLTLRLMQNCFPGLVSKPRNGVNDKVTSTAQYGTNGNNQHVFYRQHGLHFYNSANGKNYFFVWQRAATTTDEFCLEVWCLEDSTRTKLIYGDFNSSTVYFGMQKFFDAIYCVLDTEMATNHVSSYCTKNKIIEWNSATSAWVVREMHIDAVETTYPVECVDAASANFETENAYHKMVVFDGKMVVIGGYPISSPATFLKAVYSSGDGKNWTLVGNYPLQIGRHAAVVFRKRVYVIGGYEQVNGATNAVYYSSDLGTWTQAPNFPVAIYDHAAVVFAGKIWVISGNSGGLSRKIYYSSDGENWTEAGTDAFPVGTQLHDTVVYDGKMWTIGGSTGTATRKVYHSTDGATWTEAGTDALPVALYGHGAIVLNNRMWVVGGRNASTTSRKVYHSTDGATWTEAGTDALPDGRHYHETVVYDNKMWIVAGYANSSRTNSVYYSTNGTVWTRELAGLTIDKYAAVVFVATRRGDDSSKLEAMSGYQYSAWESYSGESLVGVDEKKLTGTVTLSGTGANNLTGSGTTFSAELSVGDYVRIDGYHRSYVVTAIQDDTNATVTNTDSDSYTAKAFSLLPAVGDAITTTEYHPGDIEGLVDTDQMQVVYTTAPTTAKCRLAIRLPDVTAAIAQGATHLRVYRTLEADDEETARSLSLRFVADIAITGSAFDSNKVYFDDTGYNTLSGSTHTLKMVGYSAPPSGRFNIWIQGKQWIGGNIDNPGYWFFSATPSNTQFPQKYASMFDLDTNFKTCDPDDGQKDAGCGELVGDLYLFKERKIFVVDNGDAANDPRRISSTIGCVCPESITHGNFPELGGECLLFVSESGPAALFPGGRVRLLYEFKIDKLWPENAGWIRRSTGVPTDWYTRNKITGAWWKNSWWLFGGDSRDSASQIATNQTFCFGVGFDGVSEGPSEHVFAQYGGATIYEPLMLLPVNDVQAYTISHKTRADTTPTYRLTQFLDPVKFQDTYAEGAASFSMALKTRYHYVRPDRRRRANAQRVFVFLDFDDSAGLTITVTADNGRMVSTGTFTQVRQSGRAADNSIRHLLELGLGVEGFQGSFFDVLVSKVVPTTGDVRYLSAGLLVEDIEAHEGEFTGQLTPTSLTYVVSADAVPEVNAYA